MFTISLLQTNGSCKGKRYRLESSPFVIGRDERCDLFFSSRTVSRQHCAIIFDDSDVLIKDLGSRNGTVVDDVQIPPGVPIPREAPVPREVPRQLEHHSRLQIGKYTFRISIRDVQTNRPHRPQLIDLSTLSGSLIVPAENAKDAARLLSELDDLAAKLDVKPLEHEPIGKERGDARQSSSTALTDPKTRQVKSADEPHPQTAITEASTEELDLVSTDAKTGPQKIPNHLRPKGPNDSQSAAATALKNLFVK